MSARAIQRLRKEREQELSAVADESDDDDSDDDEVDDRKVTGGFGGFMDDDSDSDSDSSASKDDSDDGDQKSSEEVEDPSPEMQQDIGRKQPDAGQAVASAVDETHDKSEDLDAILEEFKSQDACVDEGGEASDKQVISRFAVITSGIDIRDLDIDHVTRTSLLGRAEPAAGASNRRGRQTNVFGPPRDGWPRPPRYVGGGIGMTSYDDDKESHPLPWPYGDMKAGDDRCPGTERWFKFSQSDSYDRICEDYEHIKQSGDPNAMALFVSHHPFVIEPLLQLSTLLYQTNQAQEGLSLLKRVLWVYECACLNSFLKFDGSATMMDCGLAENERFFAALFRLIRVSYVAGLTRACLAVSRFLLNLDPLRDPRGVLLAIDHFALLENNETNDLWLVEFVDSEKVEIFWRDESNGSEYNCSLLDLPNWAYSYALALYRLHEKNPSPESELKANDALTTAFKRFPSILEDLLVRNEVDLTSRSLQTDWPSVLGFARAHTSELSNRIAKEFSADPVLKARITQSFETVARIFVLQNFKLWSADHVLKWCFRNLENLKDDGVNVESVSLVSPAIIRYERCDTSDYTDRFQTMPADAVPLDPALVAHAQNIDPNRRRMMQRGQRGALQQDDFAFGANQQGLAFAGPPTQEIDPDWPLLEIFWRSALPWAHVEGVPPPPR